MTYTYTNILSSDTIGDSLSSVNNNYLNLDEEITALNAVMNTQWEVMKNYYLEYSPFIKGAVNTANSFSPNLINATTVIQKNSAGWLKPVVVFYPTIFSSDLSNDTILTTLSSWVSQNFPVIPAPTYVVDPTTGVLNTIYPTQPSYVQGQELIVYAHSWISNYDISINTLLQDQTTCITSSEKICATCKICYYGGTYCGTDTWLDCGGNCTSCSKCLQLNCNYDDPPYTNAKNVGTETTYATYANSGITANINIQYQDVAPIQRLFSFVFSVNNCDWEFQNSLTV